MASASGWPGWRRDAGFRLTVGMPRPFLRLPPELFLNKTSRFLPAICREFPARRKWWRRWTRPGWRRTARRLRRNRWTAWILKQRLLFCVYTQVPGFQELRFQKFSCKWGTNPCSMFIIITSHKKIKTTSHIYKTKIFGYILKQLFLQIGFYLSYLSFNPQKLQIKIPFLSERAKVSKGRWRNQLTWRSMNDFVTMKVQAQLKAVAIEAAGPLIRPGNISPIISQGIGPKPVEKEIT